MSFVFKTAALAALGAAVEEHTRKHREGRSAVLEARKKAGGATGDSASSIQPGEQDELGGAATVSGKVMHAAAAAGGLNGEASSSLEKELFGYRLGDLSKTVISAASGTKLFGGNKVKFADEKVQDLMTLYENNKCCGDESCGYDQGAKINKKCLDDRKSIETILYDGSGAHLVTSRGGSAKSRQRWKDIWVKINLLPVYVAREKQKQKRKAEEAKAAQYKADVERGREQAAERQADVERGMTKNEERIMKRRARQASSRRRAVVASPVSSDGGDESWDS